MILDINRQMIRVFHKGWNFNSVRLDTLLGTIQIWASHTNYLFVVFVHNLIKVPKRKFHADAGKRKV